MAAQALASGFQCTMLSCGLSRATLRLMSAMVAVGPRATCGGTAVRADTRNRDGFVLAVTVHGTSAAARLLPNPGQSLRFTALNARWQASLYGYDARIAIKASKSQAKARQSQAAPPHQAAREVGVAARVCPDELRLARKHVAKDLTLHIRAVQRQQAGVRVKQEVRQGQARRQRPAAAAQHVGKRRSGEVAKQRGHACTCRQRAES